jgi:RimJ/RimL family protein N-acetyltransferase
MSARYVIEWPRAEALLSAIEPTETEVEEHAAALAAAYNDAHNRAMLTNTAEMSRAEVIAHYAKLASSGSHPFLLYRNEALTGDADFRRIETGRAEFTIMVAARSAQGKGLGTRYGLMLHKLAFWELGLARVYITLVRENTASRRLFEKLGYTLDTSPEARAFADAPTDVSMSLGRLELEKIHHATLEEIRIRERG